MHDLTPVQGAYPQAWDSAALYAAAANKPARKKWPWICIAGIALVLVAALLFWPRYVRVYGVRIGTRELGAVHSKEAFWEGVEALRKNLCTQYGMDVQFAQEPELYDVELRRERIPKLEQVLAAVGDVVDRQVKAAAIYVNDHLVAATETVMDANWVLDEAKRPFQPYLERGKLMNLQFVEKVEVRIDIVPASLVKDKARVYFELFVGTQQKAEYTVQEGDTLWSIANAHDMLISDLKKANVALMLSESVRPGDKLSLAVPNNVLNFQYERSMIETLPIPYETEIQRDDSKPNTVSEVKKGNEGINGEQEVRVISTYINGSRTDIRLIESTRVVLKEPKNQVVTRGTKVVTARTKSKNSNVQISKPIRVNREVSSQGFM